MTYLLFRMTVNLVLLKLSRIANNLLMSNKQLVKLALTIMLSQQIELNVLLKLKIVNKLMKQKQLLVVFATITSYLLKI